MTTGIRVHPFTVQDFHRMVSSGILTEDDRVELLDGEVVEMTPIGPRHAACVRKLTACLVPRVGAQALVSVQNAVQIGPRSELYPDVALLRPESHGYTHGHPGPSDVLLLIEVADTTLEQDRTVKLPRYAQTGIPEVWLVDLAGEQVHVFHHPSADSYQTVLSCRRGSRLEPVSLPGLAITVDEILP